MPNNNNNNNSYFKHLNKEWTKRHKKLQQDLFKNHKDSFDWLIENSKQLAVGSLAGVFLLTSPVVSKIPTAFSTNSAQISQAIDKKVFLVYDLKSILPQTVEPLTSDQELAVSEILTRDFGFNVVPELSGKRLNASYGFIGQEQHLARFSGDNMYIHFENLSQAEKYWDFGMAPGLGAWGYFINSQNSMTQKDIDREKYYIAVQTFLAPGFSENPKEYVDFFKYRKMLVVNPENGKAVVVVIGDAGPARWTGKHLGGSPEVMTYLERFDGAKKGPVLYFFIDDPNDTIPLGPINSV
jgi:hypothetical protein